MQITLKMMEKMDHLLDETEQYLECANRDADNSELRAAYMDLARCHFDGYKKLARCADHACEQKRHQMQDGETYRQMVTWHKDKFEKKAEGIEQRMSKMKSEFI